MRTESGIRPSVAVTAHALHVQGNDHAQQSESEIERPRGGLGTSPCLVHSGQANHRCRRSGGTQPHARRRRGASPCAIAAAVCSGCHGGIGVEQRLERWRIDSFSDQGHLARSARSGSGVSVRLQSRGGQGSARSAVEGRQAGGSQGGSHTRPCSENADQGRSRGQAGLRLWLRREPGDDRRARLDGGRGASLVGSPWRVFTRQHD